MSQTFYRLTHHDWVECFTKLSRAELGVLFYLRTLNPFGDRRLKINCQAIGEILDIHRTSVSRALKKLEREDLIELEITAAQVKLKNNDNHTKQNAENDANPPLGKDSASSVHPRTECASTHGERASTHGSVHPRTIRAPEPPPDIAFELSQTNKTYTDFKKTLSESERENFLKFVEKKIHNLEKPINDLEAWLASKTKAKQNRWEVYYENYQQEEGQKTTSKNLSSDSTSLQEKKLAIKNWQEYLKRQEEIQKRQEVQIKKNLEPKSQSEQESKTTTDLSKGISDPCREVQLSDDKNINYPNDDIDGYINSADNDLDSAHSVNHPTDGDVSSVSNPDEVISPQESESERTDQSVEAPSTDLSSLKQEIDQILNGFSRVDRDHLNIPPEKSEQKQCPSSRSDDPGEASDPIDLNEMRNEGLQYLRRIEDRKSRSEIDGQSYSERRHEHPSQASEETPDNGDSGTGEEDEQNMGGEES